MLNFSANLSMLFQEFPWPQRFAVAREAGFESVEIQFPYELPWQEIRRQLDDNGLHLALINVPAGDLLSGGLGLAGVASQQSAFQEAVQLAAEYASALDVPAVNVLAGRQTPDRPLADSLHTLAYNLTYAADIFAGEDIITCFEAINTYDMPDFLISGVAQMQDMLDAVQHDYLRMQFDIYHMARMGEDILSTLRENIQLIGHIQFADLPGRGAPGTGRLPLADYFDEIAKLPYRGCTGAEYRPQGPTLSSLGWMRR